MAVSTMGVGQALDAAVAAGKKARDTGAFDAWLKRAGLGSRGSFLRSRLRSEFERGVELGSRRVVLGYGVWERGPGDWRTELESSSSFDSAADASAFVKAYVKRRNAERRRNPVVPNPCGPNPVTDVLVESLASGVGTGVGMGIAAVGGMPIVRHYIKALRGSGKNPECATTRKGKVTDRALRYRANQKGCKPRSKRCLFCGSQKNVEVCHLSGDESDGDKKNLVSCCRSCNTTAGAHFARIGLGRKTRQYNAGGAQTLAQWVAAVTSVCRRSKGVSSTHCATAGTVMPVDQAVQLIRDTSASQRSAFARQIWARRGKRGTRSRGVVPF